MLRFIDYDENMYHKTNSDYDTKVLMIDLAAAVRQPTIVRELIKTDCARIRMRLKVDPTRQIRKASFPIAGTPLKAVVHIVDRSPWLRKSSNVARFTYKEHDFNFVVRDKFYTEEHYVLATKGRQRIKDCRQLEAALLICQILGDTHEAVFNRAHPAYDGFHVQFIQRACPVWDGEWLVPVERSHGNDPTQLSERLYARVQTYESAGVLCDLLFRWTDRNGYEVAAIPRKPIESAGPWALLVKKPLGGLEMAGFFPVGCDDSDRLREVELFASTPGRYVEVLRAFAAEPAVAAADPAAGTLV